MKNKVFFPCQFGFILKNRKKSNIISQPFVFVVKSPLKQAWLLASKIRKDGFLVCF